MSAPLRSEKFTIRLRPHQRAKLESAADDELVTLSEFIRDTALERAERVLEEADSDG